MNETTGNNKPNEAIIEKRQRTRKVVFVFLIIALSLINCLLLLINYQGKKENKELIVKLQSTETLKAQLESDYQKISAELKEYKGKNSRFDSLLAVAQASIDQQKMKIEELIRKDRVTGAEYAKAKQELEALKSARDKFVYQIDSLEKMTKSLLTENKSLKQTLDTEKENVKKLLSEKEILAQKVAVGSILKAQNVTANGIKSRSGGEAITYSVKKAEKIKVCFEIEENKVAEKGEKKLLIRIVNPSGSCLTDATEGSASFKIVETGEMKEFSIPNIINYDNQRTSACAYWKKTKPFVAGKYSVEIFYEGYLIGKTNFELKQGMF